MLLIVGFGCLLVYQRFIGFKSQAFQAIAHLFVGGLYVHAVLMRNWTTGILALLMSFAELLAFLRSRRVKTLNGTD